jgi:hypothetical protein
MATLTLNKQATSGRVGSEWIGRARMLRNKTAETAVVSKLQVERMLAPLRPRAGFKPMPRHDALRQIRDRFSHLPEFGRLDVVSDFSEGKLKLAELRLTPTRLRFAEWQDEDWETAISVTSTVAIVQPPHFAFQRRDLCCYGLHAVSRRFERGNADQRSDEAVIRDMHQAVRYLNDTQRHFEIPLKNGAWVGENILIDNEVVAMIRTFR